MSRDPVALCALQLRLSTEDFSSQDAFAGRIQHLSHRAARACGDAEHRLLVFPENLGLFLPLLWSPAAVRGRGSATAAMRALAARRIPGMARAMWTARSLDPQRALLLCEAPRVDRFMRDLFSAIAREHRAHVVAGSHLMPLGHTLSNTSYLFDPRGELIATTHKVNLVPGLEDDLPGGLDLARGHRGGLPVAETPWGRLSTLICYDGFVRPHTSFESSTFEDMGARADALGVRVVANPAANPWPWSQRWVYAHAGSERSRCEQWRSEGLFATLAQLHNVRYGVTAHLCGRILDVTFEGRSEILFNDSGNVRAIARCASESDEDVATARIPRAEPGFDPRSQGARDRGALTTRPARGTS